MKLNSIILLAVVLIISACGNTVPKTKGNPKQIVKHDTYPIEVYDYENLKKSFLEEEDDTIRIINFWATWCKPCIEEMPYFEYITQNYPEVDVTMVSLDFPKHIETKLVNYLVKNNIRSKVVLLDDEDANFWINDVDKNWSGAIPATIIYTKNKRNFFEKSFTKEELINIVESFN